MKNEALKLAQPAQKIPYPVTGWKVEVRGSNKRLFITGVYGDTIFVDLPVQEILPWTDENVIAWCLKRGIEAAKDAPPPRPWVGLTDEDIGQWIEEEHDVLRWAEAKLKEKNA